MGVIRKEGVRYLQSPQSGSEEYEVKGRLGFYYIVKVANAILSISL